MNLSKDQIPFQTRLLGNLLLIFHCSDLVKTYEAISLATERLQISDKEFYLLYGFNWTPEGWVRDRALREIRIRDKTLEVYSYE